MWPIGREGGRWYCTARAKSDIYDCLVTTFVYYLYFILQSDKWLLCPSRGAKHSDQYVCLYVCRPVCLSVCLLACISKTTRPNLTKFSVHVACGRVSIPIWQQRNTLCTSSFMNDVIFSHNRANRSNNYTHI